MKKLLPNLLLAAVFLAGLTLLLYPTISNYVNERHQSHVVSTYESDLAQLPQEDYGPMLQAAEAYNAELAKNPDRFLQTEEDDAKYQAQLNPTQNGIMGFVEIDAIRVKLPIYHGTDESVLQVGVGHIEGTSLPVGGTGTHSAISGHRGLPSAMLFTDWTSSRLGTRFVFIRWIACSLPDRFRYGRGIERSNGAGDRPAQDYARWSPARPMASTPSADAARRANTERCGADRYSSVSTEEPEAYASTAALVAIGVLILVAILRRDHS